MCYEYLLEVVAFFLERLVYTCARSNTYATFEDFPKCTFKKCLASTRSSTGPQCLYTIIDINISHYVTHTAKTTHLYVQPPCYIFLDPPLVVSWEGDRGVGMIWVGIWMDWSGMWMNCVGRWVNWVGIWGLMEGVRVLGLGMK